jgi:hypothetical protein
MERINSTMRSDPASQYLLRGLLAAVLALSLLAPLAAPAPASAAGPVTFTLTIKSAFARTVPSFSGQRAASLFQGQSYPASGRSADNVWVRLIMAGVNTETWIPVSYGTLAGDLAGLPVLTPAIAAPGATPAPGQVSAEAVAVPAFQPGNAVIPTVSQTARDIYQRGLQMGNNPRAFSKIGDCQAVPPYFLAPFDYGVGAYTIGAYGSLNAAIEHFSGSFARQSIAANSGFNVATVFVPLWADPQRCLRNESPLACEFRLHRPSIALISMETWWGGDASGYESYLRRIVEFSIAKGTVPILATKADNIEGNGSINAVIVKLAAEYDVPLWNFWAAVQPLPSHGLHPDGFHLTWERPFYDDPAVLEKAWPVRNLTALQAIDAVWRGLTAP